MTTEDKELLSKDLCSRLPYGVKIKTEYFTKATLVEIRKNISYGACKDLLVTYDISGEETPYQSEERSSTISKIKPYLFPLSNMTEEQYKEWCDLEAEPLDDILTRNANGEKMSILEHHLLIAKSLADSVNYCYKNHFDIYGLIPIGLAIDATGKNIY